ncbi:MAG TPA: hypothetical protein VGQ76_03195 [Thermoanaerobaculia bacterium]|jgi:hypothetical protein|nr:hypothetical protein [Thermoanaerobaculia bacterium]
MSTDDRAFVDKSLATWDAVRADALKIPVVPLPTFVLFDQKCVWTDGKGAEHTGTIKLADGNEIPAQVLAFATSHEGKTYLIMALPSVWRTEERHRNDPHLDVLLLSVFAHEMTHTRQAESLGGRVSELETQHKIKDLNDDIIQQRFASINGFTAAFEKERDLLYAIANEPDAKKRRTLAKGAIHAIEKRRAHYFKGDNAYYAELEELFFGMEGVANWAGFRAAMHEGLSRADAITVMQGSRKWFSQDEGLALFLAIDALNPGWQQKVFSDKPAAAFDLLR